MSLLSLPNELLLEIADHLGRESDINSLVRVNKRLCNLLNDYLYKFNLRHGNGLCLYRAAWKGCEGTVPKVFAAGMRSRDISCRVYNPITMAMSHGHDSFACKILEYWEIDPNLAAAPGDSHLFKAVRCNAYQFARLI